MPAGTNTTSCTSSRGRSEFLAKITAGMAEAGGTETKQSQERGVSEPHQAIWGQVEMCASPSCRLSTIPARAQQTLRKDTAVGSWAHSRAACAAQAPGSGVSGRAYTASSRDPAQPGARPPSAVAGPPPSPLHPPPKVPRPSSVHTFWPPQYRLPLTLSPSEILGLVPGATPPLQLIGQRLAGDLEGFGPGRGVRGAEPEPSACSSLTFHQGARQYYFLEGGSVGNLGGRRAFPSAAPRHFQQRYKGEEASGGGKEPT